MKLTKLAPIATGVAALGLTVASGPALATGLSYTVDVGGSTANAGHAMDAFTLTNVAFSVKHLATGAIVNMACDSADATGTVYSGSGVTDIADITGTNWYNCTGPGGAQTVTHFGTWNLHGTGTPVSSALTDVVAGHIDNVDATVAAPFGLCTFRVSGAADGNFDEANQELNVTETGYDGSLYVSEIISGCGSAISVGDPASFEASYAVDIPDGPANAISQP